MTTQPRPQTDADRLSEEDLRCLTAEPLPARELMSTLLWAPTPPLFDPDDGFHAT